MWSERIVLPVVLVLFVVALFVALLTGAVEVWEARHPYRGGQSTEFWVYLAAVAACASAVLGLVAVIGGAFQIRSASRTWFLGVAERLMDELADPVRIEERRQIYRTFPVVKSPAAVPGVTGTPAEVLCVLSKEQTHLFRRTLDNIDRLGLLLNARSPECGQLIRWVSPIVTKVWLRIGPYVEAEAVRRRAPDYYENARRLAAACAKVRKARGIEEVFLDDMTPPNPPAAS